MVRWIDVGETAGLEFAPGALVLAEGIRLAIFRVADGYRAVENACPHGGAPLADGEVRGEAVVCPMHHWEFDLGTGACNAGCEWNVRVFPARERDGRIEIGLHD